MTIVEHIKELRTRLLLALAGILVGTIVGFIWYQATFTVGPWRIPFTDATMGSFRVWSLGEILKEPYCQLPPEQRFGQDDECRLLATSPFEMFLLRLKVGAIAGLVLSAPWWLYQVWAFITPGLVRKERRNTLMVVTAAALLFIVGAVLAYVVVAYGLEFLLQIGDNAQIAALTGGQYFDFVLMLILIFGVSFELPLFIIMLNMAGLLPYEAMKDKRRHIILLLFIFAAFMTPGQDPVSMIVLALSLCFLMELAIQFTRINDKRRAKSRPDWLDLNDESASPIAASGGIGGSGGIDAPQPIGGSSGVGASGGVAASGPVGASGAVGGSGPVAASQIGSPAPAAASGRNRTRPTRNSRPPRPQPQGPEPTPDLSQRSASDFDDVL